jgi:hypothetical protein
MFDAVCLDGAQGLIQKRAAQVPVVVGFGRFLYRPWMCRTSHTKILSIGVDSVNMPC